MTGLNHFLQLAGMGVAVLLWGLSIGALLVWGLVG